MTPRSRTCWLALYTNTINIKRFLSDLATCIEPDELRFTSIELSIRRQPAIYVLIMYWCSEYERFCILVDYLTVDRYASHLHKRYNTHAMTRSVIPSWRRQPTNNYNVPSTEPCGTSHRLTDADSEVTALILLLSRIPTEGSWLSGLCISKQRTKSCPVGTKPVISACWRLMPMMWKNRSCE